MTQKEIKKLIEALKEAPCKGSEETISHYIKGIVIMLESKLENNEQ